MDDLTKPDAEDGGDNAFSSNSANENTPLAPRRDVYLFAGYRGTRKTGEERRAYRGRIGENWFYRSADPRQSARRNRQARVCSRRSAGKQWNEMIDASLVYRGTVRRPMPFAEDDTLSVSACRLLPVTRFRRLRFIRAAGSRLTFASGRSKSTVDLARTDVEWGIKKRIALSPIEYIYQYYVCIYDIILDWYKKIYPYGFLLKDKCIFLVEWNEKKAISCFNLCTILLDFFNQLRSEKKNVLSLATFCEKDIKAISNA